MRRILKLTIVVALLAWTKAVWASDEIAREIEMQTSDVGFVVVGAAHEYADASRAAHRASRDLGVELALRELDSPNDFARGHQDSGSYVSVEQSDDYSRLRPGYFIVIAASGDPRSAEFQRFFAKARRVYPDAYVFHEKVYQGCLQ